MPPALDYTVNLWRFTVITLSNVRNVLRSSGAGIVMFVRQLVMPIVGMIVLEKKQSVAVEEIARVVLKKKLWVAYEQFASGNRSSDLKCGCRHGYD